VASFDHVHIYIICTYFFVVAELDRAALVPVPLDHLIVINPKCSQLGSRDFRRTEDPDPITCLELQASMSVLVFLHPQLFICHMVHEGIRRGASSVNFSRESAEWPFPSENHFVGR